MSAKYIIIILFPFYLSLSKCNIDAGVEKEINFSTDSLEFYAFLNKFITKEIDSTKYTFIYAKLRIKNITNKNIVISLKKFKLFLKGDKIGILYIDSIASIINNPEIIKPHGVIERSIYWAFEGKVDKNEIINAKIFFDRTYD